MQMLHNILWDVCMDIYQCESLNGYSYFGLKWLYNKYL